MAVHRANNLAKRVGARMLLTTFTDGLAQGLREQMAALNPAAEPREPGLCVTNIDKLVRHVIATAGPATIEAATQRVLGMPASRVQPYRNDETARVWEGLLLLDANVAASLPDGTTNETSLQREQSTRALFDHVVVDEAQDFNAGHWRFLRACVDPGPARALRHPGPGIRRRHAAYIRNWLDSGTIRDPHCTYRLPLRIRGSAFRILGIGSDAV